MELNDKIFNMKNRSTKNINKCPSHCNCGCHNKNKNLTQIKELNDNIINMNINQNKLNQVIMSNKTEPNKIFINMHNDENINNNNIKDFHMLLNEYRKSREKNYENYNIVKTSSFNGINADRQNNNNNYKNLSLNYYDFLNLENNNNINCNENFFDDENETENIYPEEYSMDNRLIFYNNKKYINNIKNNNLYSIYNNHSNMINKARQINNNKFIQKNQNRSWNIYNDRSNNYYDEIENNNNLEEEEFNNTNDNYKINPLGHIVDNFVTMLKDKNQQRFKIIKRNIIKTNDSFYNKYREDIMVKKKKLENMSLINNKIKNNYSCYDIKKRGYPSENTNKINNNKKKFRKNERNNKTNNIKEMNAIYIEKSNINDNNKLNDNFNFSFDKKNFNNKASTQNGKKKNNNNNKYSIKNKESLNIKNKYKNEKSNKLFTKIINNSLYTKKESIRNNMRKKRLKLDDINKQDIKYKNKEKIIKKTPKTNINALKKKKENIFKNYAYTQNVSNNLQIENFNLIIQDKKRKRERIIPILNEDSFDNKSAINRLSSPHKFKGNIEIQNISNLSYSPFHSFISKENLEQSQTLLLYRTKNLGETVAEKVRKLIMKRGTKNNSKTSLSKKLNLNTDLSLSDSEKNENNDEYNKIKRNIDISSKTIFSVYYKYNKVSILAFDYENKLFSLHDFSDFGNFEENYKLSLNNKGNLFLNVGKYLYIITGKNYDLLYLFDSEKKTIIKLCKLGNNHSNGNLICYENNLICLSGDFNKSVEIYYIKKNIWDKMPEMIKERSSSGVCILNNKYIFNLFGYNSPSKQYLDNIEYFDITNKLNKSWKLIDCKAFSLKIKNFFSITQNNKIIIIGGVIYNEIEEEKIKYNNNFIKMMFSEDNFGNFNDIKIEELIWKIKDNNKNKDYSFLNVGKKIEDKNEVIYEVFDDKYNCHIFKGINNTHDLFYANF